MRVAFNETGKQVLADERNKAHSYTCLDCGTSVILKAGQINVAHFSHKSTKDCTYSNVANGDNKMSAFHREIQEAFFVIGAQLEVAYPPSTRAAVVLNNRVYEIQNSRIDYATVASRNAAYKKVMWIVNVDQLNHLEFPMNHLTLLVSESRKEVKLQFDRLALPVYAYQTWADLVTIATNQKLLAEAIRTANASRSTHQALAHQMAAQREVERLKAERTRQELEVAQREVERLKNEREWQALEADKAKFSREAFARFRQQSAADAALIAAKKQREQKRFVALTPDQQAAELAARQRQQQALAAPNKSKYPQTIDPAEVCNARLEALRDEVEIHLAMPTNSPHGTVVKDFWEKYCNVVNTHQAYTTSFDEFCIRRLYEHWTTQKQISL